MKKSILRLFAAFLIVMLLLPMLGQGVHAQQKGNATILFTHDLHSHFLPTADRFGGTVGGYARLMTLIRTEREKNPEALLLDGGDFSMGSLFQTAFTTSALELRLMGAMGYDVTTFGNHEFDYLPEGLAQMLNVAKDSGDVLPAIVQSNYWPADKNSKLQNAMDGYGVREYLILERNGIHFVIFGIMGKDADDCAPNAEASMEDPAEAARRIVTAATEECRKTYGTDPVVICLSHSGTSGGEGEDYALAQAVEGIDVIISGHTHSTLREPIRVGDTYVVSAGQYGEYLGVLELDISEDAVRLVRYELQRVDDSVQADPVIEEMVLQYKLTVDQDYLSQYGVSFDMVLTNNPYRFDTVDQVYATQHESTLGNLYSDAYHWAVEELTDLEVDVALTAAGVIRESLPQGSVTVSDVFNAASLGVGTEGELIAVYITGKDLRNAMEVDASVQPIMKSAQLFFSGVEYRFNTNRMIFNKVDYCMLRRSDGTLEKIDDDKLYLIVTGMYAGQMLGAVEESSFGLLSITPRTAEGDPIPVSELGNYVVKDRTGQPLKEWYAIAGYLGSMRGHMDEQYASTDGRKVVYSSWNPIKLLRGANWITLVTLALILILVAVIYLVVRKIVRKYKRRKK